jgi:hypothetical protein
MLHWSRCCLCSSSYPSASKYTTSLTTLHYYCTTACAALVVAGVVPSLRYQRYIGVVTSASAQAISLCRTYQCTHYCETTSSFHAVKALQSSLPYLRPLVTVHCPSLQLSPVHRCEGRDHVPAREAHLCEYGQSERQGTVHELRAVVLPGYARYVCLRRLSLCVVFCVVYEHGFSRIVVNMK